MEKLVADVQQYLQEVMNVSIDVRPWTGQRQLPIFLVDSYKFYEISLFGHPCLLMVAKENTALTPAVVSKHWAQVQKKCGGFCIYVQTVISSYNRKRLVEHHIPFIVPGNQIYLPHFGVDLREHFRRLHSEKRTFFSPGTQTVVIYALVRETNEKLTPSFLAKKLGYTLMTVGRAFEELQAAGIGEIQRMGRERYWCFLNKKALWDQVKPLLRSPVKKRIWVKHDKPTIIAGLSALAQMSMLSPPTLPVFAVSNDQWKQLGVSEVPSPADADVELEIWHYDPRLFAKDCIADPFSVYLSLEANEDERIGSALEEMMEKIAW